MKRTGAPVCVKTNDNLLRRCKRQLFRRPRSSVAARDDWTTTAGRGRQTNCRRGARGADLSPGGPTYRDCSRRAPRRGRGRDALPSRGKNVSRPPHRKYTAAVSRRHCVRSSRSGRVRRGAGRGRGNRIFFTPPKNTFFFSFFRLAP